MFDSHDADVVFWDTYNSAPMPLPGREESFPLVLREFLAASGSDPTVITL